MTKLKEYDSTAYNQLGAAAARHLNRLRAYNEEAREELFRALLHTTHALFYRYDKRTLEQASHSVLISNNVIRLDIPHRIEWLSDTTPAIWDTTNNKFTVFGIEDHPVYGKFTVTALGFDMYPKSGDDITFKELLLSRKFKGKYAANKRKWQQENK